MNPKFAAAEEQRQKRLMQLYDFARKLPAEDRTIAVLTTNAVGMFGVSRGTARDYATVVIWKLDKGQIPA